MTRRSYSVVLTQLPPAQSQLRLLPAESMEAAQRLAQELLTPQTLLVQLYEHETDGAIRPVARLSPKGDGVWYTLRPTMLRGVPEVRPRWN